MSECKQCPVWKRFIEQLLVGADRWRGLDIDVANSIVSVAQAAAVAQSVDLCEMQRRVIKDYDLKTKGAQP